MWEILVWLLPLAIIDSLNPVTIAVQVFIMGMPGVVRRTIGYIVGIYVTYLAGGLVLFAALAPIRNVVARLPETVKAMLLGGAGLLLLGFGVYLGLRAGSAASRSDTKAHRVAPGKWGAFWIGVVVTATDVPTAVPYIAAIERLLHHDYSLGTSFAALALYCVVYLGPLILLLAIFLRTGEGARTKLQRVPALVARWSEPVLAVLCAAAGAYLLVRSGLALGRALAAN